MGADNSTLSRLCGPQNPEDVHSEIQSEISQQHQRSKTDNYDDIEDSSSEGNINDNDIPYDENEDNNDNTKDNAESENKYNNQALLVLMERELQSTKDEQKRVINKYDIKLSEIESELRDVKSNLRNELDHKQILENKLISFNEEYNKLKTSQNEENTSVINEYKESNNKLQEEFDEYNEQKTSEIEEYKIEIDNYKQQTNDLDEQINQQKDENNKMNNKNQELQNKINEILNNQMSGSGSDNSAYTQKIEILETEINELNEYKQNYKNEMNCKTDEITDLKSEMNKFKQFQATQINTKLEEIKTLKAEITELKMTNDVKQETINALKLKLQNVGQPINNTYISENKQEENSQISTQELEDLNNMINELKSNNNKLQTQNKELEIMKTEHQKCQTIIVQLKQEIQLLKDNNNNNATLTVEPIAMDNDVYSVTFDRKPFGITFSNTKDKKNLIVNKIDPNSIAYELNVIAKSKIIALENEAVEDLGAKYTFKMFKGKFGNKLPLKITFRKPFGSNAMLSDNYTSMSDYNSDDNKTQTNIKIIQPQIQFQSDEKYDIATEVTHVYEWLKCDSSNKQSVKQLKEQLASLLTNRRIIYKQELCDKYKTEYNKNIQKDIQLIIGNGLIMDIINGLLMTYAQYDIILIIEYIKNNDFDAIADIICCRNIKQLNELKIEFKKQQKLDIKGQLKALAQNNKKKTLVKVMESIFNDDRKDEASVDMDKIGNDLTFIFSAKKFKDDTKERLAVILTANSVKYIRKLNEQFMLKNPKDNLAKYVDKKLGNKSTVGYYCKTRVTYAMNSSEYFGLKIRKFGTQFKKYQKQIIHIFIGRMEIDLSEISKQWTENKYGGGKDLKQWITSKMSNHYDRYYLEKILDNCSRYAS